MATAVAEPRVDASVGVTHEMVAVNGIRLHVTAAGDGPPVVLLHGFPEFWYSWRRQIPALVGAGFRAVAPDLRGYNLSDKPPRVRDYRTALVVADVAELIRHHLGGQACVVGHDWGGIIAWRLAQTIPDVVRKLAILNAPLPAAYLREVRRNPGQWLRSSYVLFFQLPWLPERVIRSGDYAMLERGLRRLPHAFSPADIAAYKQALDRPGALTAGLNYYRAAMRYRGDLNDEPQRVDVPTLLLWGRRDPFESERLADGLGRWVRDLRVVRLDGVGHWVQNEAPERVNRELVEFFRP